jgi:hypothetical protein
VKDGVTGLLAYVFMRSKSQDVNFYYAPRDQNGNDELPTFLVYNFEVGIGSASVLQLSTALLFLFSVVLALF